MSSKSCLPVVVIALLCSLFISCATLPGGTNDRNLKLKSKYQTVEIDEQLNYLTTKIRYPQFEDTPELNKRIENSILSNWKNFKSYSKGEWQDIVALNNRGSAKLPPFEYIVTFEVSGTKNIISVILNTYIYNGGAHGNTSLTTYNYDLTTKKFIDIQQATGMSYKDISSVCRNYLYKKLIDDEKKSIPPSEQDSMREMINTGAFPQAGNFELFTVDGSKVYAWFEPYSVAPYSYGIQKVQVK